MKLRWKKCKLVNLCLVDQFIIFRCQSIERLWKPPCSFGRVSVTNKRPLVGVLYGWRAGLVEAWRNNMRGGGSIFRCHLRVQWKKLGEGRRGVNGETSARARRLHSAWLIDSNNNILRDKCKVCVCLCTRCCVSTSIGVCVCVFDCERYRNWLSYTKSFFFLPILHCIHFWLLSLVARCIYHLVSNSRGPSLGTQDVPAVGTSRSEIKTPLLSLSRPIDNIRNACKLASPMTSFIHNLSDLSSSYI